MKIFNAIGVARQHLVEGGGIGPSGFLGQLYLKAAHELLKAGHKMEDEVENAIFNEETKLHEYLAGLKAAADAKVEQDNADLEEELQPPPDAPPAPPAAPDTPPAPPAAPDAPAASGALDSASGPAIP